MFKSKLLCADQQYLEKPLSHRCNREELPTVRTIKTMEENQTQDLTMFNKFAYVLGVRKRDFFIDSIINTIASIHMKRTLLLYYTQGTLEESDSLFDSFPIQNNFLNSV